MRITTNLHVIISCFLFLLIMSEGVNAQMQVSPEGLTCEYLRQPGDAVITDSIPKFSWIFPREGRSQQAYRILVSSNLWTLKEGHADLWDSGIIKSSSSINIKYNGKSLISNQSFWWKVKVWTTDADSSYYSDAQMVNLGDLFRKNLDYPGQSRWIEVAADQWVSEDRQCAHFSTIGPDTMLKNSEGNYFVQFPRAAFGTLAFTAFAKDAQKIKVFLGERNLGEEVHKDPGVSNIGFVELEMNLEKGLHSYVVRLPDRPKSHYLHSQKLAEHYPEVIPFRFAELIFDQQIVEVLSVEQKALFYYFDDDASRFICSDDRLQRIWDLCKYTLKATPFLGVYADGNRERMPYEADAYIQQLGHYSVDREYAIGRYTLNFLFDHASWPTEWQMHTVLMAWQHYMYTGDLDLFVSRYDDLKRKSLYQLAESNGLISTRLGKKTRAFLDSLNFPGKEDQFRDIVDWPQGPPPGKEAQNNQSPVPGGETDGYVFTDFNTVVNAYHNRCLVIMSEIAGLVGKTEDAQFFRKQADKHKQAFLETFFDAESGLFRDGDATQHSSLHANMFALVFDLVPEGGIDRVVAFIKSRGMACSVYGAQFLLEALFNAG
ncbi:MAG: hypothetical protein KDC53_09955, partial [Saprospiraceae bacterium]|nr:hypothetical protein [Saprospiraceae bacterium]